MPKIQKLYNSQQVVLDLVGAPLATENEAACIVGTDRGVLDGKQTNSLGQKEIKAPE